MRRIVSLIFAAAAGGALDARADTQLLDACVNMQSGEIKIAAPGQGCPHQSFAVQLQAGPESPVAPPPPASGFDLLYITGGIYPNTSVARAFCPPGWKVTGGGGITAGFGFGLQQSYPISDESGTIAFGDTAIGWQAAADDFGFAQAFVVCAH